MLPREHRRPHRLAVCAAAGASRKGHTGGWGVAAPQASAEPRAQTHISPRLLVHAALSRNFKMAH
eukprot:4325053-Prymnesium_polylepis.1